MAYFWVDRAQTYLQSLGFDDVTGIVHEPFHVKVGQYGGDNSYQTDKPYRIRLGKGGVDDAEDAEVIVHEYGHAVHASQVPGFGTSLDAGSIGEAFGDYLGVTVGLDAAAQFGWPVRADEVVPDGLGLHVVHEHGAALHPPLRHRHDRRRRARTRCTPTARSGRRRCGRSAGTTSALGLTTAAWDATLIDSAVRLRAGHVLLGGREGDVPEGVHPGRSGGRRGGQGALRRPGHHLLTARR